MDAATINPFIQGTLYILDTTASLKARPGVASLKTDAPSVGDISGVLSITGDIAGSVSISFTERSILGIVSAMFGEQMTLMDEDITDAVGEICNMVSGHVTTKMTEMGKKVRVKLQEVKTGTRHSVVNPGKVLVFPFETTKGNLTIGVSLDGSC
jgi:chemotaxis protein CheX